MKSILRTFLAAFTAAALLAACGQKEGAGSGQGRGLRKITIAQYGEVFWYAPVYVTFAEGFFADEGLDVTFVSTGGDEKTWAALVSGAPVSPGA